MNTTLGPGEILGLQLDDVDLERRLVHVRRAVKTCFRERTIPLNDDALWAVEQMLKRARRKGACEPDHYLLPHRYGPEWPQGVWRKAWAALTARAAERYPRLGRLRRYDFRHTAITKQLEAGVPEATVQKIAGHRFGSQITEVYSHARIQAKVAAVEVLQTGYAPKPGHVRKPARHPASVPAAAAGSTLDFMFRRHS